MQTGTPRARGRQIDLVHADPVLLDQSESVSGLDHPTRDGTPGAENEVRISGLCHLLRLIRGLGEDQIQTVGFLARNQFVDGLWQDIHTEDERVRAHVLSAMIAIAFRALLDAQYASPGLAAHSIPSSASLA
jgi:acetylornithine deacetylase/succinyl-diaminopimelate desuccinylase-like protein